MTRHALQAPLDELPRYLEDALRIYAVLRSRMDEVHEQRRATVGTARGAPSVEHKSLNRAVVVAAVGALEAFMEDLALTARELVPGADTAKSWFPVQGTAGMVQTPSSNSISKMMWAYFRYDPRPDWTFLVTTAWSEVDSGYTTNWRGTTTTFSGDEAAKALDAMVKVRHGFAHQDRDSLPNATPGIVALTPRGKLSLQSHHAFNSMSIVAQAAIQTTVGIAGLLPDRQPRLRWKKAMQALEQLLVETPAMTIVRDQWNSQPFSGGQTQP